MNELVISGNNPLENIKQSTDVAGACKEIVSRSAIQIQGKKYVPVEGWMSIATAHGCVLSATDVRQVEGGISAKGIVRRIADGLIIGEAEGFVGDDEKTWANRPLFARRAMSQTRAMSRAARSVFAHVVVLMDAGLSTTPAEEMEPSAPAEKEIKPEVKSDSNKVVDNYQKKFELYFSNKDSKSIIESIDKLISFKSKLTEAQWNECDTFTYDHIMHAVKNYFDKPDPEMEKFLIELHPVTVKLNYGMLQSKIATIQITSEI